MRHLFALLLLVALPARAEGLDGDALGNVAARPIGPGTTSGRIAAIDAVQGEKLTLWVGSASGGVWKSMDGGITFKPVFDKHTQSIGAVTIDPQNPQTVWVGTGESWVRNSTSVGTGVYRTSDGGDNWQRLGLENTERIARIVVGPKAVLVCATGHAWNAHPDRGVYRTADGGRTWTKVLYVNDSTGCADLAADPHDPKVLWAAMWQFRRTPWSFTSGGPGSGLYKSTDGGISWRKVTRGLPKGQLGRIAIAPAPSVKGRVYVYVEAKTTGVYRSDDGGESFYEVNSGPSLQARPFYFGRLVVDPSNADRVYKPGLFLSVSEDGGKSFSIASGSFHSDVHDVWVNPKRSAEVVIGTDGGVYLSEDRANHWRFVGDLPVAQFYHVSADNEVPYNVYGGLQDNGSWMAPSRRPGGIGNRHWQNVGMGDGFWAFPDSADPNIVYVEYQGGNILRVNRKTLETKEIKPFPPKPGEPKYRFNWNTPIALSPVRKGVIYLGAQYLLRSKDRGESWERISPDLTTNDPQKQKQEESGGLSIDNSNAENHCTIYAIAESPKDPNVIWVGTDDGNVQVTRDGGRSWTNVTGNVGVPKATWVSSIEASHTAPGTAYATFDGHALGDMKSYVYRTTDFGKSWQALATPDVHGYAHVVREDPKNPKLLFLGTEFGLWISIDGGATWGEFKSGGDFPPVAVRDLYIQAREGDLVIATHGRGVWILDDLTPLRALTPDTLAKDFAFLPSRPSELTIPASEQGFEGDEGFDGQTLPEEAVITYYLKKRHIFGDLTVEILDGKGKLLSTIPGGKRRGLNRVTWPMRLPPPKLPPAATEVQQLFAMLGPRVPEGTYKVRVKKGDKSYESTLRLLPDPRSKHSAKDRALQQTTVHKLYGMLEDLTYLVDAVADLEKQAGDRVRHLPAGDGARKATEALLGDLEAMRGKLVATREVGMISGEEQLRERLGALYGSINGFEGRPTDSQLKRMDVLSKELAEATGRFEAAAQGLSAINAQLSQHKLEPLHRLERAAWHR